MKTLKYHGSNNFSYKTCNFVIYQNIILKIIIEKKKRLVRNLRVIFDWPHITTTYSIPRPVEGLHSVSAFLAEFQAVVHDWFR